MYFISFPIQQVAEYTDEYVYVFACLHIHLIEACSYIQFVQKLFEYLANYSCIPESAPRTWIKLAETEETVTFEHCCSIS